GLLALEFRRNLVGAEGPQRPGDGIDGKANHVQEIGQVSPIEFPGEGNLDGSETFFSDQNDIISALVIRSPAIQFGNARCGVLEDNLAVGIVHQDFGPARLRINGDALLFATYDGSATCEHRNQAGATNECYR